ncbi:DUF711 family protein [bacterium]|nr:DUF711 family protein [bacterium]
MTTRHAALAAPLTWSAPPLEVRTVTLGINAGDLANRNLHGLCENLYQRILEKAGALSQVCSAVAADLGVPILQRRVTISPIDRLSEGHSPDDLINIARTLDGAASSAHLDQISGFFVRAQHGMSKWSRQLIAALPTVLAQTARVHAAVEVATSSAGINMDAVDLLGKTIRDTSIATADRFGAGAARLAVLGNVPDDGPPIAGAFAGDGWNDLVVFVSVSAMGPIRHAIEQRLQVDPQADLACLAGEIRSASFQATRVAELVGREIATRLHADLGKIDVSLAPTIRPGQTIAELLKLLGVPAFGSPGTTAALALISSAIRTGGQFASTSSASEASILLPVLRDAGLVSATEAGSLALEHLASFSAVGGQGLDLIPIPGDTPAGAISAVIADQMAMAAINGRTTVVRLVPVAGRSAGERVTFDRDLGDAVVLALPVSSSGKFVMRGGRIPTGL